MHPGVLEDGMMHASADFAHVRGQAGATQRVGWPVRLAIRS